MKVWCYIYSWLFIGQFLSLFPFLYTFFQLSNNKSSKTDSVHYNFSIRWTFISYLKKSNCASVITGIKKVFHFGEGFLFLRIFGLLSSAGPNGRLGPWEHLQKQTDRKSRHWLNKTSWHYTGIKIKTNKNIKNWQIHMKSRLVHWFSLVCNKS